MKIEKYEPTKGHKEMVSELLEDPVFKAKYDAEKQASVPVIKYLETIQDLLVSIDNNDPEPSEKKSLMTV